MDCPLAECVRETPLKFRRIEGRLVKVKKFEAIGEARKVFLTSEQRKRLLDQCTGSFRDLIEVGFLTGARYGELRSVHCGRSIAVGPCVRLRQGTASSEHPARKNRAAQCAK